MVRPIHNNPAQYGDTHPPTPNITPTEFNNAIQSVIFNLKSPSGQPNNLLAAQTELNTIYQYVSPDGPGNTTSGGHTLYLFLSNFIVNTTTQPNFLAPQFQISDLNAMSNSLGLLTLFSTLATNAIELTSPSSDETDFVNVASILTNTSNSLTQADFESLPCFIFKSFKPFLEENTAISAAFGSILSTTTSPFNLSLSEIMSMAATNTCSTNLVNFSNSISDFFATFTLPDSHEARVISSALFSTLLGFLADPNPVDHGFDSTVPLQNLLNQPTNSNSALGVIALLYLGEPDQMFQANGSTLQSGFQDALWKNLTQDPSFFPGLIGDWSSSNGLISYTDPYLEQIESFIMGF
jgi:hypothetical protein